jgi:hypothetical protein
VTAGFTPVSGEVREASEFAVLAQIKMEKLAEIVGVQLEQISQDWFLLRGRGNDFYLRGCPR